MPRKGCVFNLGLSRNRPQKQSGPNTEPRCLFDPLFSCQAQNVGRSAHVFLYAFLPTMSMPSIKSNSWRFAFWIIVLFTSAAIPLTLACSSPDEPTASPTSEKVDSAQSVYDGEESFQNRCAVCHGQQADGTQAGPPLVNRLYESDTIPTSHSTTPSTKASSRTTGTLVTCRRSQKSNQPRLTRSSATSATSNAPKASKLARRVNPLAFLKSTSIAPVLELQSELRTMIVWRSNRTDK